MARPLSSKAREKILSTAGEVLFELGVSGFTADEVARRSGVAKTTIYRHFDSSDLLMVTALDASIAPFPTPNTGSLDSDLRLYAETTSQIVCEPRFRVLMLELLAASANSESLTEIKESMLAERMGPIRTVVELAMARGEIPSDLDPLVATELAESPFLANVMMHPHEPPDDAEIQRMIDFVVAGLQGM